MQNDDEQNPLGSLDEWEEDLVRRYPESGSRGLSDSLAATPSNFRAIDSKKTKAQFRDYDLDARPSVREFYRLSKRIDRKGQSVKWIGAANAVGDGKAKIVDTEYNLANGYFFLVTQRDGVLSVKQLKRDRTRSPVFRDYVQELSAENEFGRFFGNAEGPDSGEIN